MDLYASADDISPNKRKRASTLSSSLSKRMKKARSRVTETFEKISSPRGGARSDDGGVFARPLNEVVLEQRLRLMRAGFTAVSWVFSPALPFIVSASMAYLRTKGGITTEGIFRVSGFHESIVKLRQYFNQGVVTANLDDDELFTGCHEVAGVLKLFLRELPAPLLTYELYPRLIALADEDKEPTSKVEEINSMLATLPEENCHLFRELLFLLHEIASHSQVNCMGAHNLATVIGPALMWPPPGASLSESSLIQLQAINSVIKVIELMITHVADFTSLVKPIRPLPAEPVVSDASEEGDDSADKGLLRRLRRMSRSFHESPSRNHGEKRLRQYNDEPNCGVEEWEKEFSSGDGEDEDRDESGREAVLRSFREKRFSLPVGHSILEEIAKEIDKEKLVCLATPTLTASDEVAQMSPAPILEQDKENADNVLVLSSPYRPTQKQPSPHPKKFCRTSLTVVRVRTKKNRAAVGDAFAEPAPPSPLAERKQN